MKVFLGGTCADSNWRNYIIPKLECDYFNPVVDDWTPECQQIEEQEKVICDYHLYVITPKMKGVFSIAEAVNDSIKLPAAHCIFCVTKEDDDRDYTEAERKSFDATSNLIRNNGGAVFNNLDEVVAYFTTRLSFKVKVPKGMDEDDVEVYVDGREVDSDGTRVLAVEHIVKASLDGCKSVRKLIEIENGESLKKVKLSLKAKKSGTSVEDSDDDSDSE